MSWDFFWYKQEERWWKLNYCPWESAGTSMMSWVWYTLKCGVDHAATFLATGEIIPWGYSPSKEIMFEVLYILCSSCQPLNAYSGKKKNPTKINLDRPYSWVCLKENQPAVMPTKQSHVEKHDKTFTPTEMESLLFWMGCLWSIHFMKVLWLLWGFL